MRKSLGTVAALALAAVIGAGGCQATRDFGAAVARPFREDPVRAALYTTKEEWNQVRIAYGQAHGCVGGDPTSCVEFRRLDAPVKAAHEAAREAYLVAATDLGTAAQVAGYTEVVLGALADLVRIDPERAGIYGRASIVVRQLSGALQADLAEGTVGE